MRGALVVPLLLVLAGCITVKHRDDPAPQPSNVTLERFPDRDRTPAPGPGHAVLYASEEAWRAHGAPGAAPPLGWERQGLVRVVEDSVNPCVVLRPHVEEDPDRVRFRIEHRRDPAASCDGLPRRAEVTFPVPARRPVERDAWGGADVALRPLLDHATPRNLAPGFRVLDTEAEWRAAWANTSAACAPRNGTCEPRAAPSVDFAKERVVLVVSPYGTPCHRASLSVRAEGDAWVATRWTVAEAGFCVQVEASFVHAVVVPAEGPPLRFRER